MLHKEMIKYETSISEFKAIYSDEKTEDFNLKRKRIIRRQLNNDKKLHHFVKVISTRNRSSFVLQQNFTMTKRA